MPRPGTRKSLRVEQPVVADDEDDPEIYEMMDYDPPRKTPAAAAAAKPPPVVSASAVATSIVPLRQVAVKPPPPHSRGRPRMINPDTGKPLTNAERKRANRAKIRAAKEAANPPEVVKEVAKPPEVVVKEARPKKSPKAPRRYAGSTTHFIGEDVKVAPAKASVNHHGKGKSKISAALLALRRDRLKAGRQVVKRHRQTYSLYVPRTGMTALSMFVSERGTISMFSDATTGAIMATPEGKDFKALLTAFMTKAHRARNLALGLGNDIDMADDDDDDDDDDDGDEESSSSLMSNGSD